MLDTPVTTKDLLIGISFGILLTIATELAFKPSMVGMSDSMNDEVFELKRENARLEGENSYYKRFVDSTITVLDQDQRIELLNKM